MAGGGGAKVVDQHGGSQLHDPATAWTAELKQKGETLKVHTEVAHAQVDEHGGSQLHNPPATLHYYITSI